MMINVAVVDDNIYALRAIREKLSGYSDIDLVCIAQGGQEVIDFLEKNSSLDVVLMDIEMPQMNGIEATAVIKQKYPSVKVIMITVFDDDEYIFNAIKAGADSYILKESKSEKIYDTIIDTLNGGSVMSPSIAVKALQLLKKATTEISSVKSTEINVVLSVREIEILEQLSRGMTNKAIAESLFISPFTVKRHIENIYQKLQAHNRIDLIEKAKKGKLI
ncbi:MAG TPA: response regulator transcription factor [Bacteroidia bacterium]|nr:response regulator transcription factor [Bacteroidia bacterium]QQR96557.1 MAG: response regulator transcription factor [Bacteroidota bacterium]MBP7714916.1 response regulator transcription factor [Bacteroidia bacterium]MBP8668268.1 response regulator transcription factor [Bacteroidia bacterium]HOZ81873.1 response regulator transcription factor [Bacteroidia bacterium]